MENVTQETKQGSKINTPEGREWLNGLLREQYPITVTFTKKDGSARVMRCTRSSLKIPVDKQSTNSTQEKQSETNCRVFDIDKNEWRSFNYDSVTRIEFTIGDDE